jgi:hypothetical protein
VRLCVSIIHTCIFYVYIHIYVRECGRRTRNGFLIKEKAGKQGLSSYPCVCVCVCVCVCAYVYMYTYIQNICDREEGKKRLLKEKAREARLIKLPMCVCVCVCICVYVYVYTKYS